MYNLTNHQVGWIYICVDSEGALRTVCSRLWCCLKYLMRLDRFFLWNKGRIYIANIGPFFCGKIWENLQNLHRWYWTLFSAEKFGKICRIYFADIGPFFLRKNLGKFAESTSLILDPFFCGKIWENLQNLLRRYWTLFSPEKFGKILQNLHRWYWTVFSPEKFGKICRIYFADVGFYFWTKLRAGWDITRSNFDNTAADISAFVTMRSFIVTRDT